MTCRHCGTTIDDRALICYRCGTATAEPASRPSTTARPAVRCGAAVVFLLAAVLVAAAAAWMLPRGAAALVAWSLAAALGVLAGVRLARCRRRATSTS